MTVKERLREIIDELLDAKAERLLDALEGKRFDGLPAVAAEALKRTEKAFVPPTPDEMRETLRQLAEMTEPDAPVIINISRGSLYQ